MSNTSAVDVEVRVKFVDGGSSANIRNYTKQVEQAAARATTATERQAEQAATVTERSAARQRTTYERLASARESLGVRSERSIQREIQVTEAAYNRLARSGTMSWREQALAADKMRQKVAELRNEMGRLTAAQKLQAGLKFGGAAIAGAAGAAYALKGPTSGAISYDERLANMANTAFAERDFKGRRQGMSELEAAINKAVGKGGGGTREEAAEALDTLIASGAFEADDAKTMLPQLMRFQTATGASANQLAQIGIRAMQTFKIKPDELPNVLNMALAAGQAGGFELRDMAKWLPQQMASATMSGMSGRSGFAKLAALNQAAVITAGTKDEAGNNVVNLLSKINSSDTANDAKKLGINLPKYLQERRAKGIDSVDAFGELVSQTVNKRDDYKALQKKLAAAKGDDQKKEALEGMATIAQGAGIGKLIQDRQALMALLGMMNNADYMKKVLETVRQNDVSENGAGDKNYELMASTPAFQLRMAQQQKDIGQKAVLDGLTPAIGRAAEAFGDLANKHPLLVGSLTLATGALGALAGAAGLASIAMGGKAGPVGGAIGRAATWAAGSGLARGALRGVGIAGAAGLGAAAGDWALGKTFGEESAITRYGSSGLNGAAIGAAVGSIIPVVGTGIGAAVGGIGGLAWEGIKDLLKPAEQKPVDVNANLSIGLAPGLVLQQQVVETNGMTNFKMNTGNVWNGAPR